MWPLLPCSAPFCIDVVEVARFDGVTELAPGPRDIMLDGIPVVTLAMIEVVPVIDNECGSEDTDEATTVLKLAVLVPVEAVAYGAILKLSL